MPVRIVSLSALIVVVSLIAAIGCRQTTAPQPPAQQRLSSAVSATPPVLLHVYDGDASDGSGNNFHGQIFGSPSFDAGCIDQALHVDGAGDHVIVAYDALLEPQTVSVEAYFKPDNDLTAGAGFVPIVVKLPATGNVWNTADGFDIWYQDTGSGGRIGFGIGANGGSLRIAVFDWVEISSDRFHHVVGTYDGSVIALYLDGVLLTDMPHSDPIAYLGGPIYVGGGILHSFFGWQLNYFDGAIDEVAVYDYALSAQDVADRAARCDSIVSPEPPEPGPVLQHHYVDNTNDDSGHENHGVANGDPKFKNSCIDRAIVFDGDNDFVSVASTGTLQPAVVTVELLFRPHRPLNDGAGFVPLVVKLPDGGNFWNTADGYDLWYQDSGGGGRIGFGIATAGGTVRVQASKACRVHPGRYTHVVGTYDGNALKLYLDGTLVATTPHSGPIAYLGGPVKVGGDIRHSFFGPGRYFFDGNVDELVIYNKVLTAEEISERSMRCRGAAPENNDKVIDPSHEEQAKR